MPSGIGASTAGFVARPMIDHAPVHGVSVGVLDACWLLRLGAGGGGRV